MFLCYHHTDNDGKAAAYEVYKYIKDAGVEPIASMFIQRGYDEPYIEEDYKNKNVFIVDLSFTHQTLHYLEEIIDKAKSVVWIDHHDSSLELFKDKDVRERLFTNDKLIALVNKSCSGALLSYIYRCFISDNHEYTTKNLFLNMDFELVRCLLKITYDDEYIASLEIPRLLRNIDLHDRWAYGDDMEPVLMNYGCQGENTSLFINGEINRFWMYYTSDANVQKLCAAGEGIKKYNETQNAKRVKSNSFEAFIKGKKALVLNTYGNSLVFGDNIDKYDLVCIYSYNGKLDRFIYSIYSNKPEIDCASIATQFGGGGHKGAAGFSSKDMLFRAKDGGLVE